MERDRIEIVKIISDMLDHPDDCGLYPTSTAYTRLEWYINAERMKAIGWAHTKACIAMDRKEDPRLLEIPDIIEQAEKDLEL